VGFWGVHPGVIGTAELAASAVTPAKLSLSSDFTWTGVHSFAGGKLVLPTAGGTTAGEVRFCTMSNTIQVYYSATWNNLGNYLLGCPFRLPMTADAVPSDGAMCWDSANYRPAVYCGGSWRTLSTQAEMWFCYGVLCSCLCTVCSCLSYMNSGLMCVCSCVMNHESRIYALEHK
jgi:hypothetical protein